MSDRDRISDEMIAPRLAGPAGQRYSDAEFEEPQRNPLKALTRHWLSFLIVLSICLGGGWYYLHRTPLAFTSQARVYVQQHANADTPVGVNTTDSYLYLQSELIKSNDLLMAVVNKPQIANIPAILAAAPEDKVRTLRQGLDVEIDKGLSIINISYTSLDRDVAVLVANTIFDQYVAWHTDPLQPGSPYSRALETKKAEKSTLDKTLAGAQEELGKYLLKNPTLYGTPGKEGGIVIDAMTQASVEWTQATSDTVKARAQYEAALAAKDNPEALHTLMTADPSGVDPNLMMVSDLTARAHELELQIAVMSVDKLDKNSELIAAKNRLSVYNSQIADLNNRIPENYISRLKQRYQSARALEEGRKQSYQDQQESAKVLPALKAMQEDVERYKKRVEGIDKEIYEIQRQANLEGLNITSVQRGDPLSLDISPRPRKVMAMATVMGLFVGALCAFLLDITDRRIRSVDEVRFALKRPVLGAIPHARGNTTLSHLGRQVDLYPHSEMAEAFRIIRTAIQLTSRSSKIRPILVTSPFPNDGKTICCSNIAIAMAKAGRRTLLIDADLRNPSQSRVHSVDNKVGLVSVLRGDMELEPAIQWTGIEGLDILPAGSTASNPSELLNTDRFRLLLRQCSAAYDVVLVDAPPVMPVADTALISSLCKSTLLVMRAGKCTLKDGVEAVDRLVRAGANIMGVVVNDVRRRDGYDALYAPSYVSDRRPSLPSVENGVTSLPARSYPGRLAPTVAPEDDASMEVESLKETIATTSPGNGQSNGEKTKNGASH